jgi:hypothetical protein
MLFDPFEKQFHLREVGEDSPIVGAVGIGPVFSVSWAARNFAAKTGVIQLLANRLQTSFDVAQTFSIRELSKRQTQKVIATRKTARTFLPAVLGDTIVEFSSREKFHPLGKHEMTVEHKTSSAGK